MIDIGNIFALLALLSWPIVGIILFRVLPLERALIWSILGAYMFLPQLSAINLPGIPALNKETIPNLVAFGACMAALGRMPHLVPEGWVGRLLMGAVILSPSITVLTNLEPVSFGVENFGSMRMVDPNNLSLWGLPGLRLYDSASALVQQVFLMLPFFLAREILRTQDAIEEILKALVVAGLIYALPMLWEVRFSPQLHTQLYGFFQHDFAQAMRDGGFRPFVFMPHGLWVAFFAFMCTMAAAALARSGDEKERGKRFLLVGFMFGLVVICKSMGALLFTLAFVPMVLVLRPRLLLLGSAILAVLVVFYPVIRGSGLIPTEDLVAWIETFNPERAQSLGYRFGNEDLILEHVQDKPWFGWGGWGRFMVYDPSTGESLTIVDGQWVITIGHYGWLGFIAMFGLLILPILSIWWRSGRQDSQAVPLTVAALVLILAVNLVDLLPNATLIPFTWLIAGALLGYAEEIRRTKSVPAETATKPMQRSHRSVILGAKPARARNEQKTPKRRTLL